MPLFNKQKFFIALICTLLGWTVGFWMGKKQTEENFAKTNRNFGVSQFFGIPFPNPSPVEESPSLIDRFLKKWGQGSPGDSDPSSDDDNQDDFSNSQNDSIFDSPLTKFGFKNSQPKLSTREDDQFVYMEFDLNSLDKNSMNAKVENDTVVIEGNQKSDEGGSSMSSHFYQSFPAPAETDTSKVDMTYENNKLILKFPKKQK